jgi:hypothetical protein
MVQPVQQHCKFAKHEKKRRHFTLCIYHVFVSRRSSYNLQKSPSLHFLGPRRFFNHLEQNRNARNNLPSKETQTGKIGANVHRASRVIALDHAGDGRDRNGP